MPMRTRAEIRRPKCETGKWAGLNLPFFFLSLTLSTIIIITYKRTKSKFSRIDVPTRYVYEISTPKFVCKPLALRSRNIFAQLQMCKCPRRSRKKTIAVFAWKKTKIRRTTNENETGTQIDSESVFLRRIGFRNRRDGQAETEVVARNRDQIDLEHVWISFSYGNGVPRALLCVLTSFSSIFFFVFLAGMHLHALLDIDKDMRFVLYVVCVLRIIVSILPQFKTMTTVLRRLSHFRPQRKRKQLPYESERTILNRMMTMTATTATLMMDEFGFHIHTNNFFFIRVLFRFRCC